MLQKYHKGNDYIIRFDPKLFDMDLSYEEELIDILARDVWKLRT